MNKHRFNFALPIISAITLPISSIAYSANQPSAIDILNGKLQEINKLQDELRTKQSEIEQQRKQLEEQLATQQRQAQEREAKFKTQVQELQQQVKGLPSPWTECGTLSQLDGSQLPNFPILKYEYGIAYNSTEPMPINITSWNKGVRIYNKYPYFVNSDNPLSMNWGGFIFYKGTDAADNCPTEQYPHQYWKMDKDGITTAFSGNGCLGLNAKMGDPIIYCRRR